MLISPWTQYNLQLVHNRGESRTAFLLIHYSLLLAVQEIDLPLGNEKMKGVCPDNLRGQECNYWKHNHLKSAYWFQRMVVMLIPKFWIFYLNWFFTFSLLSCKPHTQGGTTHVSNLQLKRSENGIWSSQMKNIFWNGIWKCRWTILKFHVLSPLTALGESAPQF